MKARRIAPWPKVILFLLIVGMATPASVAQDDPLPSWNDGPAKKAILDFVARVTKTGSLDYVPLPMRIATFDNDGTLWTEQPIYTQFAFAIARVRALAPLHPEWKKTQPFNAILKSDMKTFAASGEKGVVQVMIATHAGMTTDEFAKIVADWMKTARHPRFKRPYTECVYEPMLEVLRYLRTNGFTTYIVSGGGVEFMRPWVEQTYGVPPQQVIGSSIKTKFEMRNGQPVLVRMPEANFVDDKAGKPVGINEYIGLRPIAAFGNSDGDQQMLEWTAASTGARLMLIVHHTDAEREYAYDRESRVGTLDTALNGANAKRWVVVDMKKDWKTVFPTGSSGDLPH